MKLLSLVSLRMRAPRLYDTSSNASAKATSFRGLPTQESPPGSEYAACEQGLLKEPRRSFRGLKGNKVIIQDLKIKFDRNVLSKEVRSFHSSEEVW